MMNNLFSTAELSNLLRIQPFAIRTRKYCGISLPQGIKVGKHLLWPMTAVATLLKQQVFIKH